ncbi:MAG TPA: metallophosphoesterase [Lichenihabitans sp.]|jgi:hypothetical protein|nr:metallophosphoesterase [Lichenihabitans sp.]
MPLITRRQLLIGSGALTLATGGYAVAGEPMMTPRVTRYAIAPAGWPEKLSLRLAVVADIHACEPWMTAERIRGIAETTNALDPDLILLLGDFNAGHRIVTGPVMPAAWADALSILRAPLGTFAILGNHDWWHGPVPGMPGGPEEVRRGLRSIGVTLLENRAVALAKDGQRLWIAGLADQMAHLVSRHHTRGADDLAGTLRQVTDDAPVVLMAHEPYVFRRTPARVALTLCGHTHGGQVDLPIIGAPWSPSRRYNYGHIVEDGRNLIVSGGLGESGVPVRLGRPPEILDISLGRPVPTA